MEWGKFIDENRAMIDEFLGPNQETYTMIALKGKLATELGREEAFKYFEQWMRMNYTPLQTNVAIRKILTNIAKDVFIEDLDIEEKKIYLNTLREEFL